MRLNRRRGRLQSTNDLNPLEGVANLMDVMCVFSCGLLVALVMAMNLQDTLFKKTDAPAKNQVEVQQGQELKQVPDIKNGSGSGMSEMGTVYQDPATGKLIMVIEEAPQN